MLLSSVYFCSWCFYIIFCCLWVCFCFSSSDIGIRGGNPSCPGHGTWFHVLFARATLFPWDQSHRMKMLFPNWSCIHHSDYILPTLSMLVVVCSWRPSGCPLWMSRFPICPLNYRTCWHFYNTLPPSVACWGWCIVSSAVPPSICWLYIINYRVLFMNIGLTLSYLDYNCQMVMIIIIIRAQWWVAGRGRDFLWGSKDRMKWKEKQTKRMTIIESCCLRPTALASRRKAEKTWLQSPANEQSFVTCHHTDEAIVLYPGLWTRF